MTTLRISPLRSLLFIPAHRTELLEKMVGCEADGVVIDCESAETPEQESGGRANARSFTARFADGNTSVFVRVHPPASQCITSDVQGALCDELAGVLVPNVETTHDLDRAAGLLALEGLAHLGVIVGLESCLGVADARVVLQHPNVRGVYFGAEDYVADLGGTRTPGNTEVLYARSRVALAARLAGVPAFDQVKVNHRDREALVREASEGRSLGFTGKLCWHTSQVAPINQIFEASSSRVDPGTSAEEPLIEAVQEVMV